LFGENLPNPVTLLQSLLERGGVLACMRETATQWMKKIASSGNLFPFRLLFPKFLGLKRRMQIPD
jgi:hypothetical protein